MGVLDRPGIVKTWPCAAWEISGGGNILAGMEMLHHDTDHVLLVIIRT
jgi:hypothetical protein